MRLFRLFSIVLIVILTATLTACAESDDSAIDIAALCDEMLAADSFPEMLNIRTGDSREERGFSAISNLDYTKVEAFNLYYAADGTSYELAVIALKDAGDMNTLEASLKAHIHTRIEQYRNYDATQVSRAECDDPAAVRAVFDKVVR